MQKNQKNFSKNKGPISANIKLDYLLISEDQKYESCAFYYFLKKVNSYKISLLHQIYRSLEYIFIPNYLKMNFLFLNQSYGIQFMVFYESIQINNQI
ncbi:hypothetical protein DPV73_04680 [Leptospira mayottensis]|nr:hypothetical protein DPV73_04680 [Leptospira mayottensis]